MANDYASFKDGYQALFDSCVIASSHQAEVQSYLKKLEAGQERYKVVAQRMGDMPWQFVGIIHAMECSFNFKGHLHNGDPLTARTVHVPANRPLTGNPPFTWEDSAVDALTMKNYNKVTDWSVAHILYLWEAYNGFGYRNKGINTPYLWSYSNQYTSGKYGSDGKYDPNLVSKQCGAAVMLKALQAVAPVA